MTWYVALLRGINVGGKNPVRMPELKAAFEGAGFQDVATYIQSGNVIFRSDVAGAAALTERLEALLAERFAYRASLVLRDRRQLNAVVGRAPAGFGEEPDRFRYDVVFLKDPLAAKEALKQVPLREGVDEAHAGPGVLYFSRLTAKASQSRMSRLVSLPIYQRMTIRNWNTTTTLLRLVEEAAAPAPRA